MNIEAMDRRQREAYPYRGQASRQAAYPELSHSGRSYDAAREEESWDVTRARDLLAGFVVTRRVDQAGMVSIYNRNYYVGKTHVGQAVRVRYDPQRGLWLFQNETGHQLHQREAAEIDAVNIRGLTVTNRRDRSKGDSQVELGVGITPAQLDVG